MILIESIGYIIALNIVSIILNEMISKKMPTDFKKYPISSHF